MQFLIKNIDTYTNHHIKKHIPHTNNNNIGILCGSFDPPHLCHALLAISSSILHNIQELWIIPTYHHPGYKILHSFSYRLKMCNIIFSKLHIKLKIINIEKYLPIPNYTIYTLKIIKQYYPNLNLFLIIGSDLLFYIHTWHNIHILHNFCKIIMIKRNTFHPNNLLIQITLNIKYYNYKLPNINSSNIRKLLKTMFIIKYINKHLFIKNQVIKLIIRHKLYHNADTI